MNKKITIFYVLAAIFSFGLNCKFIFTHTDLLELLGVVIFGVLIPCMTFPVILRWFLIPVGELKSTYAKGLAWLLYLMAVIPAFVVLIYAMLNPSIHVLLAQFLVPVYLGLLWLLSLALWAHLMLIFGLETKTMSELN